MSYVEFRSFSLTFTHFFCRSRRLRTFSKILAKSFFFLSLFEPNSDYRPCHDNIHCLFENRGCSSVDCYSNWFIIPLLPSAKGTQFCSKWGPNFEWDGDLMRTFASTNGDPKSDFLKIYLNELEFLEIQRRKIMGKHLHIGWLHLVHRFVPFSLFCHHK